MPIGEGQQWLEGEETAWACLARLEPADVCRRSLAAYDEPSGRYILPFFDEPVSVHPAGRLIGGSSPGAGYLLNDLHYYSRLSILWYLIQAQELPLSGNLVNPSSLSDGFIFASGAHMLPLEDIARRYGGDVPGFRQRGQEFGGVPLSYGDASFRLLPFPRVPVVLVLWQRDEEFPPRASLLFDATCPRHLPPDIVWSTAMLCSLLVLGSETTKG